MFTHQLEPYNRTMSEWRFDLDDDQEEDGDEQGEGSWTFGGRAASIFLIDASKEMCETSGDDGEDEDSSFKKAIRVRIDSSVIMDVFSVCIFCCLRNTMRFV